MTLTQKVAGGAIWLTVARIAGQVLGLASTVIVARFILPADYGVFAAAMSVLALASIFAELPVGQAIIHLRDVNEDDYDTAFTIGVLRGLFVALLMAILAWPLAAFLNDMRIAPVTLALGGYVLLLGLRNPRFEIFAKELKFSREAVLIVAMKVIGLIATVAAVVTLQSYWALVIGITATALAQVVITFAMRPVWPRLTLKAFRRLFGFSIWIAGSTVLGQIYQLVDTLSLGRIAGSAALGAYSIGNLLSMRIAELAAAPASRSLFAAFAQIQGDLGRVRMAYLNAMSFMTFLLIPVTITLVWFSRPIVFIVLGPEWDSAVLVVQLLCVVVLSQAIYTPLRSMLMGLGHVRTLFYRSLFFLFGYIPVIILATLSHGLAGLMVVKAVAIGGLTLVDMFIVRHTLGATLLAQARAAERPVLAGLVLMGVYALLDGQVPTGHGVFSVGIPLALVCSAGGLAYLATVLLLWSLGGRRDGLETRLLALAGTAVAMLRRSAAGRRAG